MYHAISQHVARGGPGCDRRTRKVAMPWDTLKEFSMVKYGDLYQTCLK